MTTRRSILASAASAPFLAGAADAAAKQNLIELTLFRLRNGNGNQRQRAVEFLKSFVPMLRRAGGGPIGALASNIGEGTPYLLMIRSYPGFAEMAAVEAKLKDDNEVHKVIEAWYAGGQPYERVDNSLLLAFPSMPTIVPPPTEGAAPNRLFEWRTYESENLSTLARKIDMFGKGEIGIFHRAGLRPVFFGETLFGRNLPNLTYMLAHDDMAAREKAWAAFRDDPEWKKLQAVPEYKDPGLVSNITVSLLSPLPFSDIR